MPILALSGHQTVRAGLTGAVWGSKLPQVILLEGPAGVGRQQVALWLGRLLFCDEVRAARAVGAVAREPCGACRGCRLVADLSHPDLHWIVPVPRPKASDAEKQVEEVAEAIGDVMAERRKNPLYEAPDGMAMHGVATVRLIQRRAAMKSVEGGPRLFIIGHAERLVPQESAQEAANALLKLLEEPPPNCYFVLTATDAGRLLPTIRSRVVSLRLGRLTDAEVRSFLAAHLTERDSAELERLVSQVDGAIGAAIGAAEGGTKAAAAAKEVMDAVRSGPLAMAARALKQNPWSARGDFSAMLEALEAQLGAAAKAAAGTGNGERGTGSRMVQLLEAMGHVAKAREAAQGNVNPQLLLSVLQDDLTRALDVRRET